MTPAGSTLGLSLRTDDDRCLDAVRPKTQQGTPAKSKPISGRRVHPEAGTDWLKRLSNTIKDAQKLTNDETMANLKNAAGSLMESAKKKRDKSQSR